MANTSIGKTFTDLFKTTVDKTKGMLKDQGKSASSDITKKITDVSTKAKSVFDEGTSKSSSFFDTLKNKFNFPQVSTPTTTGKGKAKFVPSSASTISKNKKFDLKKLLRTKKGLLVVGLGAVIGIYFLTKPKKARS